MLDFLEKHKLPVTPASLRLAFHELRETGLLELNEPPSKPEKTRRVIVTGLSDRESQRAELPEEFDPEDSAA